MILASRAAPPSRAAATSHAAVVSRALGRPCVVGCGLGRLERLLDRTVTVDGGAGKIYDGALEIEAPDETDHVALATLAQWAAQRAPLRVVPSSAAEASEAVDFSDDDDAADPTTIGAALARRKGVRGARGGVIASDEGVRAALAAGLEFIVADRVLPPLLSALRAQADMAPPVTTAART